MKDYKFKSSPEELQKTIEELYPELKTLPLSPKGKDLIEQFLANPNVMPTFEQIEGVPPEDIDIILNTMIPLVMEGYKRTMGQLTKMINELDAETKLSVTPDKDLN